MFVLKFVVIRVVIDYMYSILFGVVKICFIFWCDKIYKVELWLVISRMKEVEDRFMKINFLFFIICFLRSLSVNFSYFKVFELRIF